MAIRVIIELSDEGQIKAEAFSNDGQQPGTAELLGTLELAKAALISGRMVKKPQTQPTERELAEAKRIITSLSS